MARHLRVQDNAQGPAVVLAQADLFVSVGTSGLVYPAAGFVEQAKEPGIRTCEINLEPSDNAQHFDETHYGPGTQTVPAWVERVLAGQVSP